MTQSNELTLDVEVDSRVMLAAAVDRFDLRRCDGQPFPSWRPGAHIDLVLDDALVRQYSICGEPDRPDVLSVAVLRLDDGRGGSRAVHERLSVGSRARVRGPRNNFELSVADRYEFVAGGIGITPLIPMIREAARAGAEWHLTYGARTADRMAFRDELETSFADRVTFIAEDDAGLVDLEHIVRRSGESRIYACGPGAMLDTLVELCRAHERPPPRIERFAPIETGEEPPPSSVFHVEDATTGERVEVRPDASILDALLDAGFPIPFSCTEGTCGTCEQDVCAGTPDHRDSVLSEGEQAANDVMMVCVSRSKSATLTLDLPPKT